MALLAPVFIALFFGGILLFTKYALFGAKGATFLRLRAEESGDCKKIRRVRFLFIAVVLFSAGVVCLLLAYGFIAVFSSDGKNGAAANPFLPDGNVLLAVFVLFFLAATVVRLRIRLLMRDAEKHDPAPLSPDAEYRVSYVENPRRINSLMTGVVFLVVLSWIPIGLIVSPYTSTPIGILIGVILLVVLACLIVQKIREHRKVRELLVLDREGILDKNPDVSVGFIPWREVKDVSVSDEQITLTRRTEEDPEKSEIAVIRLDRSPVSSDTVYGKIKQYRLLASDLQRQEPPSDPEDAAK